LPASLKFVRTPAGTGRDQFIAADTDSGKTNANVRR
jgi:hypothetical protein